MISNPEPIVGQVVDYLNDVYTVAAIAWPNVILRRKSDDAVIQPSAVDFRRHSRPVGTEPPRPYDDTERRMLMRAFMATDEEYQIACELNAAFHTAIRGGAVTEHVRGPIREILEKHGRAASERSVFRVKEAWETGRRRPEALLEDREVDLSLLIDEGVLEALNIEIGIARTDPTGTKGRLAERVRRRLEDERHPRAGISDADVRALLRQMPAAATLTATAGRRQDPDRRREGESGYRPIGYPGQYVMFDTSGLDIHALGVDGKTVLVLNVALSVDAYSGLVPGIRVVAGKLKGLEAGQILLADMAWHALDTDEYAASLAYRATRTQVPDPMPLADRLEMLRAQPPIWPTTVLVDNDKVFDNHALRGFANSNGIDLAFTRVLKATDKAAVEAMMRTVKHSFAQHVRGFTGGDPANKGDVVPAFLVSEIEEFIERWRILWNNNVRTTVSKGIPKLRTSPVDAVTSWLNVNQVIPGPPGNVLYQDLLPSEIRTVSHDGMALFGLKYRSHCDVLDHLRKTHTADKGQVKWKISYDPRSLLHAWTKDPRIGRWVPLYLVGSGPTELPFGDLMLNEVKRRLKERQDGPVTVDLIRLGLRRLRRETDLTVTEARKRQRMLQAQAERTRQRAIDAGDVLPAPPADPKPEPTTVTPSKPQDRPATQLRLVAARDDYDHVQQPASPDAEREAS